MIRSAEKILTFLIAAFSAGCAPSGLAENAVVSTPGNEVKFRVETVATGLEVPWGFAWLPNKDMLVTERRGRVRIIESGNHATLMSRPDGRYRAFVEAESNLHRDLAVTAEAEPS